MGKQVTQSHMPDTNLILDSINLGKLIKAKRTVMKMNLDAWQQDGYAII
jgi:hypothetical protein